MENEKLGAECVVMDTTLVVVRGCDVENMTLVVKVTATSAHHQIFGEREGQRLIFPHLQTNCWYHGNGDILLLLVVTVT